MDIKGKVLRIGALEEKGASNFKTQDVFLDRTRKDDYSDKVFPNFTKLTFLGDKTALVDKITVGDVVTAKFNINGRFFTHDGKELFNQDLAVFEITVDRKAEPVAENSIV
ncbi:DUF3127 domain-containing protein [Chryseobacterium sp. FH1]|uniref:DUF3127 domain-containing protein n=1 Tax=Chryseobacterium sp. FH1 TaxID=1233951 RepID=UPI0004E33BD8|nr:DUF3127 domain-containing protein [Chryseobacterium sp. FH1]KFC19350.1 hypothetical protein IO90_08575 [Chryseobacterium sp. FH1]